MEWSVFQLIAAGGDFATVALIYVLNKLDKRLTILETVQSLTNKRG